MFFYQELAPKGTKAFPLNLELATLNYALEFKIQSLKRIVGRIESE